MNSGTAVISGTGLIGASIGLALRSTGWMVIGSDPNAASLAAAVERGALDSITDEPLAQPADLVVLAGPPEATIDTLRSIRTEALVTDVAGVKGPVLRAASHLTHFVGGHPMTGRAQSGAAMASANMFRGAAWILTTDNADPEDLRSMSIVVESLGSNPIMMSSEEHDRAVAYISHLPHILAASLVDLVEEEPHTESLVAGSFRDLTRVAATEASWWTEVMTGNADEIVTAIDNLEGRLAGWRDALSRGSADEVRRGLQRAQETRLRFSAEVSDLQIPLADEPGEIARVGRALERSSADIRDLQLRHAEHGGGGLLTLVVHPNDAEDLRQALIDQGFAPE